MKQEGLEKAKQVRLFLCDVDGVMTDGKIVWDSEGREIRHFDVQDGTGLYFLKLLGYPRGWISGKNSEAVAKRAKELGIEYVYLGVKNKRKVLEEILEKTGVSLREVCFVGDDLVDIPVLEVVGFPVAVANAREEVKQFACYVTSSPGGHGAVREVVELILQAQGKWQEVLDLIRNL